MATNTPAEELNAETAAVAAETHASTGDAHEADAGLLATLGIEPSLLVAQLVNFALVLFVLWRFAYKPLLKAMDERSRKIEQGLKDAAASGEAARLAEAERLQIVAEARKAAKEIADAAAVNAERERVESVARAKAEVEKIVNQGREQLAADRAKMVAEAKAEVGELVALAAEKIIRQKIDAGSVAQAIKDIERA